MTNAVELEGINKAFGKEQVLKGLNLSLPKGKILCLIGPSGCGKTTTIRIITGSLAKDSGCLKVLDNDKISLDTLKHIGYMAQDNIVYTGLTGKENLEFFGRIGGLSKGDLKERITVLGDILRLKKDLDKMVSNYSGGMKRRLALACALIHSPELLILDEPTVGLDPLLREEIWIELKKLAAEGTSILLTTHVMDEVEKSDIAALMRDGQILAWGTPEEVVKASGMENLEQAFILYSKKQEEGANNE